MSVQSYPAMMPCNSSECNLMIVWVERFEDIGNYDSFFWKQKFMLALCKFKVHGDITDHIDKETTSERCLKFRRVCWRDWDTQSDQHTQASSKTKCYTTHTVHYMFKHSLWNFNGLACGRLTINVGGSNLSMPWMEDKCVFVFQRISLCLVSCHIPGHKQRWGKTLIHSHALRLWKILKCANTLLSINLLVYPQSSWFLYILWKLDSTESMSVKTPPASLVW